MAVREALLTLLSVGPNYGFRLHTELIRRLPARRNLNVGQSYATLERARTAQLIEPAGHTDDGLPQFALTEAGIGLVSGWLAGIDGAGTPAEETTERVLLRLGLGDAVSKMLPSAHDVLRSELLAWSGRARTAAAVDTHRYSAEYSELERLQAEAMLQWLDGLNRADIAQFELAFQADRPRRGRPAKQGPVRAAIESEVRLARLVSAPPTSSPGLPQPVPLRFRPD